MPNKLQHNAVVFRATSKYINSTFYDNGSLPKEVSKLFDENADLKYLLIPPSSEWDALFIIERSNFKKQEVDDTSDTYIDTWLSISEDDEISEESAVLLHTIVTASPRMTLRTTHVDLPNELFVEAETLHTNAFNGDTDEDLLEDEDEDEPVSAISAGPGPGESAETESINRLIEDHLLQIKALMALRDELEPSSIESVCVVMVADGIDYVHEL